MNEPKPLFRCDLCGSVDYNDDVRGCLRCGFDEMKPIAPPQKAGAPLPLAPSEAVQLNGKPATALALLEALIDIHDDGEKNAPENRCYVESAWRDVLGRARTFIARKPESALEPVVSLGFDKAEDGTYSARLTVSGLPSEQQAQAAVDHMQRLFCGQEQAARQ